MHKALGSWTCLGAAQSLWSPAQPLPCLRYGTARAVLLQAPRCACRSSLARTNLLPELPGKARRAPAAVGGAACPAACQQAGSPNGWERSWSLGSWGESGLGSHAALRALGQGPPASREGRGTSRATRLVASLVPHSFQPQLWQRLLRGLFLAVVGWVICRRSRAFQSP